jgi:hypothetical protein
VKPDVSGRYELGFEDDLMDVSVRSNGQLVWYIEVKETPAQTAHLLRKLETLSGDVDLARPDRTDDFLRKAKYLVRHRPPNLSLVGGETRWHFLVTYPTEVSFNLVEQEAGPEALQ